MKTNSSVQYASGQVNSQDISTRRALKQLVRLEAKESSLIKLGQYAIALINFIEQTDKNLGQCVYKMQSIAERVGCTRGTLALKWKALLDMGIGRQRVVRKIGNHKIMERWIAQDFLKSKSLKNILCLLAFSISSTMTCFSTNRTRQLIDLYLYKKAGADVSELTANEANWQASDHANAPNKLTIAELEEIFSEKATISATERKAAACSVDLPKTILLKGERSEGQPTEHHCQYAGSDKMRELMQRAEQAKLRYRQDGGFQEEQRAFYVRERKRSPAM